MENSKNNASPTLITTPLSELVAQRQHTLNSGFTPMNDYKDGKPGDLAQLAVAIIRNKSKGLDNGQYSTYIRIMQDHRVNQLTMAASLIIAEADRQQLAYFLEDHTEDCPHTQQYLRDFEANVMSFVRVEEKVKQRVPNQVLSDVPASDIAETRKRIEVLESQLRLVHDRQERLFDLLDPKAAKDTPAITGTGTASFSPIGGGPFGNGTTKVVTGEKVATDVDASILQVADTLLHMGDHKITVYRAGRKLEIYVKATDAPPIPAGQTITPHFETGKFSIVSPDDLVDFEKSVHDYLYNFGLIATEGKQYVNPNNLGPATAMHIPDSPSLVAGVIMKIFRRVIGQ